MKIIKIILLIISLVSFGVLFFPHNYVMFGNIAWYTLVVIMFIRPLRDIFNKIKILDEVVKLRKELGIICGSFAIAHSIGFFLNSGMGASFFFSKTMWDFSGLLSWGALAFLVTIPLIITSNKKSVLLLGKAWKKVQFLAYFMFIFTSIHIAFVQKSREFPVLIIIIVSVYTILYITANILNKKRLSKSTSKKYLCPPCGYLYDEEIGDIDSGIAPGTKFEDIPDSWVCPICGVKKSEFVLINGKIKENFIKAKIIKKEIINKTGDIIELTIETKNQLNIIPGQFISFEYKDKDGKFKRSYSVSEQNGTKIKFLIKYLENGRGSKILRNLNVGETIKIIGPYGDFILKDSKNKKIFIASGTGLSPVYNMILNLKGEKTLIFATRNKNDLFYIDKLEQISELETYVFLSQEMTLPENKANVKYFNSRINPEILLSEKIITDDKNTEFYICGNALLKQSLTGFLTKNGYNNIYSEEF